MTLDTKSNISNLKKRILKSWQLQVLFHEAQIRENHSAIERIKKIIEEIEADEVEAKKTPDISSERKSSTQAKRATLPLDSAQGSAKKIRSTPLERNDKGQFKARQVKSEAAADKKSRNSRAKEDIKTLATKRQVKTEGKADRGVKREKSAIQKRRSHSLSAKNAMVQIANAGLETFEAILKTPKQPSKRRVTFAPLFAGKDKVGKRLAGTPVRKRARSLPVKPVKSEYLLPMSPVSIDASPTKLQQEVIVIPE